MLATARDLRLQLKVMTEDRDEYRSKLLEGTSTAQAERWYQDVAEEYRRTSSKLCGSVRRERLALLLKHMAYHPAVAREDSNDQRV